MDESGNLKERIDRSAEQIMREQGIHALRIRDVCSAAGVSIGTFYYYYKNKDALMLERFRYLDSYLMEEVIPHLAGTAREKLHMLLERYIRRCTERGVDYLADMQSLLLSNPSFFHMRALNQSVLQLFREGIATGEFRGDISAEYMMKFWVLLVRGLLLDWQRSRGDYDIFGRFGIVFVMGMEGVGPTG